MNKRPPAKKPQAKIQTVKKQIAVKKIAPDRIEELVKRQLGNIGVGEKYHLDIIGLNAESTQSFVKTSNRLVDDRSDPGIDQDRLSPDPERRQRIAELARPKRTRRAVLKLLGALFEMDKRRRHL
jgi:hypothetical protein